MRHRVHGRKLGRTTAHRTAMMRNQLTSLLSHERITTTVAKAKELRPLVERAVTLARTGTLANRRRVLEMVSDKQVVARLFDDIAPRFSDRPGGYTRIMRLGRRRGDNAELAIIEFVDFVPKVHEEGGGGKPSLMDRAKGMFGARKGGAPEAEAESVEPESEPEAEAAEEEPPAKPKRARKRKAAEPETEAAAAAEEPPAKPKRSRKRKAAAEEPAPPAEGDEES